jgi:cbb3-type cytochrome oxidase subunit 3
VYFLETQPWFWNNFPPSLELNKPSIKTVLLTICFILVSCLAYSSSLKMKVTCSSEMSIDLQDDTALDFDFILSDFQVCGVLRNFQRIY